MEMVVEMANNVKAHKVCEDLLSILKSSKLNYLVKETPYSAFVTIRKRFLKDTEISNVTLVSNDDSDDTNMRRENLILKEKCKSLEVDLEFLRIDKDKLEMECGKFKAENENICKKNEKIELDLN